MMMQDGTGERLALVVAVALVTYATRLTGFHLKRRGESRDGVDAPALPPVIERFLTYIPIAAFAALVAPGIAEGSGGWTSRLVAVACAAFVAWRLHRLWLSLVAGLAGYWLVELLR